jgi:hypothetical protein
MANHKMERPRGRGTWFVWGWIACAILILCVMWHTQAPLITLDCSPSEDKTQNKTISENCATIDVLFVRSWTDLRHNAGWLVHHYRDDITAISTLVVAIFTGTLWWVTSRMVRVAEEQRSDTLRSIKATERQAHIAETALHTTERAYISIDNFGLNRFHRDQLLASFILPTIQVGQEE